MTRDEMIEKAARAMYEGNWEVDASASTRAGYRFMATAALSAVCPGLLAGTHWEAPVEATDAMIDAIEAETEYLSGDVVWNIQRDAYLAEKKKS